MSGYFSNLPPGTPGPRPHTFEMVCLNPKCPEHGVVKEASGFWELGGYFLDNDDQAFCGECSWEHASSATGLHELTIYLPLHPDSDDVEYLALIDADKDEVIATVQAGYTEAHATLHALKMTLLQKREAAHG